VAAGGTPNRFPPTHPRPDVDVDALLVGCEAGVLVGKPAMAMAVI